MPLDPQVKAHLERLAGTNFADLHDFAPQQVREGMRRLNSALPAAEPIASVVDVSAETDAGPLQVRIYRPALDDIRPVIVFFHGGGFVLGDLESHDPLARSLANHTKSVVVSVDYPLSPEHKFPAALEAGLAATTWVSDHAAEYGADPRRLVVAGDSAGGNLAAGIALAARDLGRPLIAFQLLIYPDLDFRRTGFSITEFAGKYGNVSKATQDWFMDHYLNDESEKLDPRVSPVLAPDLAGLPAALIITAEYDALRDEGEAYGQALQAAGVSVSIRRYDGMIHEFLRWPFDESARALRDTAGALELALTTPVKRGEKVGGPSDSAARR